MNDYMTGATYGIQNLTAGVQLGAERLMADMGSLMPGIAAPQMHPMIQARHGMYAHEMSLSGSAMAMFGRGIPQTTTAFEYQEMAARDMGQRVAGAATQIPLYGAAAFAGWHAGGAAFMGGMKAGSRFGKAAFLKNVGSPLAMGKMGRMGFKAAGIAGGIAGAIPGMLAFEAISSYAEAVGQDVQDRQEIMNFMEASSFRYTPSSGRDIDPRFGGFNRQARSKIADTIKQIDYNDAALGMPELKGILESGTEMGMFTGTRDAEDFGRKFKELTQTLKQVTTTLHTSLAEGMKTINDLKGMGFRTPAAMSGAIMTADVLGAASGRTASEMLTMGTQGAQMVRGTGISMGAGASMMMQNVSQVSQMRSQGILSAETIAQAGGEASLAQQMMAGNVNFMRSSVGRGVMTAVMNEDGMLDPNALRRIVGDSGMDLGGVVNMASQNMKDPRSYINAFVNQNKRMKELSESYGGQGIEMVGMGTHIASARSLVQLVPGMDMKTATTYSMMKAGYTPEAIEGMMGKLENVDKFRESQAIQFQNQASKAAGEIVRRRTDFMGRMGDKIHRSIVAPVSGGLSDMYDSIAEGTSEMYRGARDSIQEKLFGIKRVQLENIKPDEIAQIIADHNDRGAPKLSISKELASEDFTDDEVSAFSKGSPKYKKMMGQYGLKAMSRAALSATDLQSYSKAVFNKPWDQLSQDEKMYATSMAKDTNAANGRVTEQITERREESMEKIEEERQKFIIGSDEAKANAKDIMKKAVMQIGKASGMDAFGGTAQSEEFAKAAMSEEGRKDFEAMIKLKKEKEDIEGQISELPYDLDNTKRAELEEKLKTVQGKMSQSMLNLSKQMQGQGAVGRTAAARMMQGFSNAALGDAAQSYGEGAGALEKAMGSRKYRQLLVTSSRALDAATIGVRGIKGKIGSSADARKQEYLSLLDKFKAGLAGTGEGLSEDEYDDLQSLAGDAGMTSLGVVAGLGESLSGVAKDGRVGLAEAEKQLKKAGITGVNSETIKKMAKGSDTLATKDLMRLATMQEFGQKGGMTVLGAGTSKEGREMEQQALTTLTNVQRQAAQIANAYEVLANRLQAKGLLD
jgi:hypothetical protein